MDFGLRNEYGICELCKGAEIHLVDGGPRAYICKCLDPDALRTRRFKRDNAFNSGSKINNNYSQASFKERYGGYNSGEIDHLY